MLHNKEGSCTGRTECTQLDCTSVTCTVTGSRFAKTFCSQLKLLCSTDFDRLNCKQQIELLCQDQTCKTFLVLLAVLDLGKNPSAKPWEPNHIF